MSRVLFRRLSPFRFRGVQRRGYASSPADEPGFTSVLDRPPTLVRSGRRRHGPGLLLLAAIPITAFALGTWQIHRLTWKTDLISTLTTQLLQPPLPLPTHIDTRALPTFDHRRVTTTGVFLHAHEMLLGPRIRDGENGYFVVTPLDRSHMGGSTILVSRGWIAKPLAAQRKRAAGALPRGLVEVRGLLRVPWKPNWFTPVNRAEKGEFYWPDVEGMAALVGAQPVWVEETTEPDYVVAIDNARKGVPIARAAEVDLRNNHMQYIVTWYGLSAATAVMFFLLVKRPPPSITKRVRQSSEW